MVAIKSSFLINKERITSEQIYRIFNHMAQGLKMRNFFCDADTPWEIVDDGKSLEGRAMDDSFDMESYLKKIGINPQNIVWNI